MLETHLAMARWYAGDPLGWDEHRRRATRRAADLPFPHGPFSRCYAESYASWQLSEMGRFDEAAELGASTIELATRHGFDFWLLAGTIAESIAIGRALLERGGADADVAEQAARLEGSAMMTEMAAARSFLPYCLTSLAVLTAPTAGVDAAIGHTERSLAIAADTGCRFYDAETHRVRAGLLRRVDPDAADHELDVACRIATEQSALPYLLRALLDRRAAGLDAPGLDELLARAGVVTAAGRRLRVDEPADGGR
jgi:hypothetical protein